MCRTKLLTWTSGVFGDRGTAGAVGLVKPCLIILPVIFSVLLGATEVRAEETVKHTLVVGNPKNLFFAYPLGDIHIGKPEVCNYLADRETKKVTLVPVAKGDTVLIIYDDKGKQREVINITVFSRDLERFTEELRLMLKDIDGVEVRQVGGKVVVEGEVFFQDDLKVINQVVAGSDDVVLKVTVSQDFKRILAQKIKREIGEPDIEVQAFRDKLILKGRVYSEKARDRAMRLAKLYWDPPTSVVDALDVVEEQKRPERADTIQITAHYIELTKMLNQNFLFKWTPFPDAKAEMHVFFDPTSNSSTTTGGVTAMFSDLIPRLNYMKSLGVVRVMETPPVSVKDGGQAMGFAGSKIMIPVATEEGSKMTTEDIGVTFMVSPRKILNEIELGIQVKVAALGTPTAAGTFVVDRNEVSTHQIVRSGESVVIGGILRTSTANVRDRQPPETEAAPGLFTLFKTRDFSMHRAQFMIFITPRILEFAKDANSELKDYFNLQEVYPPKATTERGQ